MSFFLNLKIIVFTAVKNCCILHGPVFVMVAREPALSETNLVLEFGCKHKVHCDSHVWHIFSRRFGHENISTAILPLNQEEQLSVSGERMYTKH